MNLLTTLFGPGIGEIVNVIGNTILLVIIGTLTVAVIFDRVAHFIRSLFMNGTKG